MQTNLVLFVLSKGGSPPAVWPLSQTVDEESGMLVEIEEEEAVKWLLWEWSNNGRVGVG